MSDVYRCENCVYCVDVEKNSKDQAEFGNHACRRYPPTPVPLWDEKADQFRYKSILTPVNHNWWCGEWSPRKCAATS